jgi:hypothetical protein
MDLLRRHRGAGTVCAGWLPALNATFASTPSPLPEGAPTDSLAAAADSLAAVPGAGPEAWPAWLAVLAALAAILLLYKVRR